MTASPTPSESNELPVRYHRPKAQLFSVLAVLWLFPSFGAVFILALRASLWVNAETFGAGLAATQFEQWVALLILLFHPIFHMLARYYRKNEVPRQLPPEDTDELDKISGKKN